MSPETLPTPVEKSKGPPASSSTGGNVSGAGLATPAPAPRGQGSSVPDTDIATDQALPPEEQPRKVKFLQQP